jgi:hypothetical protein
MASAVEVPQSRTASSATSCAVSEAKSFAMPASRSQRSARSFMPAAQYVRSRAASTRAAMSSSRGWPSRRAVVSSSAAWATPTARAAMLMRPASNPLIT